MSYMETFLSFRTLDKKLDIGIDDEEDFASKEHTIIVELLIACWYAILSHTDFICYFFVFLNQV